MWMRLVISLALCLALVPMHSGVAREQSVQELEERKEVDKQRAIERAKRGKKRAAATADEVISLGMIVMEKDVPPALSNLDPILQDEGIHGARIAIDDNNTTGRLTKQLYQLTEATVAIGDDITQHFVRLYEQGIRYFVIHATKEHLLTLADLPQAQDTIIFNISAKDNVLRNEQCRHNMLHVIPSRAMVTDALMQFLIAKNWKDSFLIKGADEADELFAESLKYSAKKFGASIGGERQWTLTHDIRRTARSEIPLFTKEARDYALLLLADEKGEFGEYIVFNTWSPALLAGTQGLTAHSWHRTHEQWGAAQMQNRFRRIAGRFMNEIDYAAWVAVRSVGEAVTRKKNNFPLVKDYILSEQFGIAAYKGVKVSYRSWNGQLRQRILLNVPRALVSVSPQEGYLHPVSPMDTLGFDKQLSRCTMNSKEAS